MIRPSGKRVATAVFMHLTCGIAILLLLAACSAQDNGRIWDGEEDAIGEDDGLSPLSAHEDDRRPGLTVMAYYDLGSHNRNRIRAQFPAYDFTFITEETLQDYQTYLAEHAHPDILILDSDWIGTFNSTKMLLNLAMEPYEGERLLARYPHQLHSSLYSFDRERLIALPIFYSPLVTFYRQDVMAEAGYPTDPTAMGEWLQQPDQWLQLALDLKEKDQWIFTWVGDPAILSDQVTDLFDEHLNYARQTDRQVQLMSLAQSIQQHGLALDKNIFLEGEDHPIRSGQMSMIHIGYWYVDLLQSQAADSAGEWRMTVPPFGLYGDSGSNVAAIPEASEHKQEAWAVIEWLAEGHISHIVQIIDGTASGERDDFFGNQDLNEVLQTTLLHMPGPHPTPLDEKARAIWWESWNTDFWDPTATPESIVMNQKLAVKERLKEEIGILRDYRNTRPVR